jgi:hypothetical protein
VPDQILVTIRTRDGEERDEHWPSLERFRVWAAAQGEPLAWTAYAEDDDGEWEVIARGTVRRRRTTVQ